ncbi:hypothetical protein ARMGADRAFT_1077661 [Armillaria gallica]|uniref:Uncharacterized protein n=1 Tax=Armillaria gallica TaxID=47427 RepID=A0A2H3E923_ARMGA|nr:hypothetical protein ARMGADRAFT_1077661 [Armillaria gallica]
MSVSPSEPSLRPEVPRLTTGTLGGGIGTFFDKLVDITVLAIFDPRTHSTYCIWRPFQRVLVSKSSIPASKAAMKIFEDTLPCSSSLRRTTWNTTSCFKAGGKLSSFPFVLRSETWLPSAEQRVIDCTLRKDSPRLPEEKSSQVKLARNVFVCPSSGAA